MKFKTLVIKEGTDYQEFLHFMHEENCWATSGTPHLYPITATWEALVSIYPDTDFEDVSLVTVEIKIL